MGKGLFAEFIAFMFLTISLATINMILQTIILVLGVVSSVYGLYLMYKKGTIKKE